MAHKRFVYQINTWVWLASLARQYSTPFGFDYVPDAAIDELAALHVDILWPMGVWQRSAFAQRNALQYKHEYKPVLPDLVDEDVIGSAYAIGDYRVADGVGGRQALTNFRDRLRQRGIGLWLDFVPNHIAVDHPWVDQDGFIVCGHADDARKRPSDFFNHTLPDGRAVVLAHGKDPLFPGWADTAQLNVFNPDLRAAQIATLRDIALQCDGVRCDMAMLLLDDVFPQTWRGYIGDRLAQPYWVEVINAVRQTAPPFEFIAEVYWGREYELLQQGFNYCYDKVLYDRVLEGDAQKIRQHIKSPTTYQHQLVRFIENHDEQRSYRVFGSKRIESAAVLACTLPGITLIHDGQMIGRTAKLPVQIKRQPDEPAYGDLKTFYQRLFDETCSPAYRDGDWTLMEALPGEGSATHTHLIAYGWHHGDDARLLIINASDAAAQGWILLGAWADASAHDWRLTDVRTGITQERSGRDLGGRGLFADLPGFAHVIYHCEKIAPRDVLELELAPLVAAP